MHSPLSYIYIRDDSASLNELQLELVVIWTGIVVLIMYENTIPHLQTPFLCVGLFLMFDAVLLLHARVGFH